MQLALAKNGPGTRRLALVERSRREPGPGEVRIHVAAAGICGSDRHLWQGSLPWVETAYPIWLGHEYAGTITEIGPEVDGSLLGARVTAEPSASCGRCEACRADRTNLCPERRFEAGGFAPSVVVDAHRLHVLPHALSTEAGALIEPLACAMHGLVHVAALAPGERCVVIGPGPLGILAALVAQSQAARTLLVGRPSSADRLHLASAAGVEATHELGPSEDPAAVREHLPGHGADLVVGCAGGAGTVRSGLALLRPGGRYLELALGSQPQPLDVDALVAREVRIQGAVGHRPASWREVISRIEHGSLAAEGLVRLITGRFPLASWQAAFEAAGDRAHVKVVIEPNREVS